ncbi:hypothetical protein [Dictyobacter kobayashii]|uniref:TIR domain-containing protein n=1 Tax=Dictyobacter kobayashii TaxID=2014872 RepID=A0A402ARR1_9CHLR|nr:hypothetical protein [Dictyobacter kobayashii]GCE21777.1 hypothetical protein KDK_55770 [Dictyobacter kobayashii]
MMWERDRNIKICVLYATEDTSLLDIFIVQLQELKRTGLIAGWECRAISAECVASPATFAYSEEVVLICPLLSAHFFASEFSDGLELENILERHEDGEIVLVPVLLHNFDWKQNSFSMLRTLGLHAPMLSTGPMSSMLLSGW